VPPFDCNLVLRLQRTKPKKQGWRPRGNPLPKIKAVARPSLAAATILSS
jgi:hypothetical protein